MANRKDIEIVLGFTADTAQAKTQIEQLKTQLSNLSTNANLWDPTTVQEYAQTAKTSIESMQSDLSTLQTVIESCWNPKTSSLDLNKYTALTKQYGLSWEKVENTLEAVGENGVDAFAQLSAAVAQSSGELNIISSTMEKFLNQLVKSANIQLSYAVLNQVTGAIRDAYEYTVDLNKSLNNIQIVTQKSNSEMASFAKSANKAAQALSSSTVNYSDASLIYYQQGLTDKEVAERTKVTVEMANITGQTASEVSEQLTAIWNNFDGSYDSLEKYADVITALGAATASSSEEISEGLSQFAAVADTVGLSYEYATSALATVVAKTRQSADTVGNSFKTIFARLESLNQGETLDDDTTLTKYSLALQKVGVDIKDQNGELKNMDTILDELGTKWGEISKEDKNALAYTVAGARQYTNFIALLDNWDYMQSNLDVAANAEGTVAKQQAIYEKSFEAATTRLQAAWEEFYQKILDDDALVWLVDRLTDLVKIINTLTDGLGGLPGILTVILGLVGKFQGDKITSWLLKGQETIGSVVANVTGESLRTKALAVVGVSKDATTQTTLNGENYSDSQIAEQLGLKILEARKHAQDWKGTTAGVGAEQKAAKLTAAAAEFRTLSQKEEALQRGRQVTKEFDESVELDMANLSARLKQDQGNTTELNKVSDSLNEWKQKKQDLIDQVDAEEKEALTWLDHYINIATGQGDDGNKVLSFEEGREKYKNYFEGYNIYTNKQSGIITGITKKATAATGKQSWKAINDDLKAGQASLHENADKKATEKKSAFDTDIEKLKAQEDALVKDGNENLKKIEEAKKQSIKSWNDFFDDMVDDVAYGQLSEEDGEKVTKEIANAIKAIEKGEIDEVKKARQNIEDIYTAAQKKTNEQKSNVAGTLNDKPSSPEEQAAKIREVVDLVTQATTSVVGLTSAWNGLWSGIESDNLGSVISSVATIVMLLGTQLVPLLRSVLPKAFAAFGVKVQLSTGWLWVIGAAIAAVIAGIVKLYNAIQDNTPEAKLKKLQEQTEKLKTVADEANSTWQSVNETLEGLDDAYNNIKGLEKGTYEWQVAVNKLNSSLREIITSLGLVYGTDADYYIDEDGLYQLTDKGKENAAKKAKNNRINSAIVDNAGELATNVAKQNKTVSDDEDKYMKAAASLWSNLSEIDPGQANEWLSTLEKKYAAQDYTGAIKYLEDTVSAFLTNNQLGTEQDQQYIQNIISILGDIAENTADNGIDDYLEMAGNIVAGNDKLTTEDTTAIASVYKQLVEKNADKKWTTDDKEELQSIIAELKLDKDSTLEDSEGNKLYDSWDDATWNHYLAGRLLKDNATNVDSTSSESSAIDWDDPSQYEIVEGALSHTDSTLSQRATAIDLTTDEVEVYTDLMKAKYGLHAANEEEERDLKALATRQLEVNNGLENLSDTWDDYTEVLTESGTDFDQLSEDYVKGLAAIKTNIEEIYGVEVSTDWIEDNLKEIQKLAEGDVDALDELGASAAKDYVANQSYNLGLDENATKEEIQSKSEEIVNELNGIIDGMSNQLDSLEVGATIDDSDYIDKLNEMLEAGTITASQANAILRSIGYEPKIQYKEGKGPEMTGTVSMKATGKLAEAYGVNDGASVGSVDFTMENSSVTIPYITSVAKTGGSSIVSSANKTGGSKTANKGSSSGSSGSSSKDKKNANDEIERYHHIKNVLEDLEHELNLISDAKDRAFGSAKLKLIDKEIAKYQDLLSAQESYLSEIKANYASDQAVMAGYGATFDEFGNISNYVELMTAQLEKYNSALTDEAEEEYENFKSALELYEETQDLYKEQMEQWHEYRQAIFDAQLEKIEYKLEFVIDIDDEELKYLEYLLDELDDAAYDSAEAIANLGKQIDIANDKSQAYTNSVQELMDVISPGNGESLYNQLLDGGLNYENLLNNTLLADEDFDSSKWLEDLQEAYDGLIEQQEQFSELWDDYIEKMENFWDEWKDKFDTEEERLDFLKEVASNYKNLIDILGKDNLGISTATLNRLDDVMSSAAVEKASASYQEYLKGKALYEDAVARGLDTELIDYYKEAMQEAYQDMQSDQADAAQQLEDEYTNAIDRIFEEWEDGISGIEDSLSDLANQFEMQNTIKDLYLDTYEQAYQTAKLTKDIADSIQDTDVISDKQELASLMDEINEKQASGAKMSQYELDAYQKEYELLLAKAALEDAQNAKNQVRMTRDAEGNMSYTYTADGNAISEAEDNYNDVAYQFAQLNVGQINDAQQQILQLYQDMEDALKDIDESDADRRQAVVDDYMTQIEYWEDQMQIAFDWNADLTDQTGYLQWDLADNFADTVLSQVTGYQTLEEMQDNFENSTRALLDNLADADQEHQDKVSELLDKTGMDADDMEDTVNEDLDEVQDGIDDTIESVEEMGDQFDDTLDDVMDEAEEFESTWDNVISAVIANNNELISSISSLLNYYKQLTSAATEAANAMGVSTGTYSGNNPSDRNTSDRNTSDSGKTPTSDKDINTPTVGTDSSQYWIIAYNSAGTSLGKTGPYSSFTAAFVAVKALFSTNKSVHSAGIIDDNGNIIKTLTNGATKIGGEGGNLTHSVSLQSEFDTGGYTGDWGSSEGRIATLHEKELVLNKTDTANMLNIVEMVRGIVSSFGNVSHGANANFNLGLSGYDNANSQFEQSVTINADFSGVSSRDEIQAAFDQMALQATQYMKKSK